MIGAGTRVGYVVTTSEFTEQAQVFARKHGIHLVDLDKLLEMKEGI
jgi:ribosomal protein S2